MKLYFPTSSLNFNDIFATESISPKLFYLRRNYGTKRHFNTELALNDNFLTLFTKMPVFQLIHNFTSDYEEYPIIIEITHDEHSFQLYKISDDTYATQETIYFSPDKVKLHFLSETHLKTVLAKSRLVEETKLVFRYRENFRLIDKETLVNISTSEIRYPESSESFIEKQLSNDSLFNKIKGFVYSYLVKLYDQQYPQFPSSIRNEIEKILDKFDSKLNPYFELARDQLINANKYYEKGANLHRKQTPNPTLPIIIDHYSEGFLHLSDRILADQQEMLLFSEIINYLIRNHESDHLLSKNEIVMLIDYLNSLITNSPIFNENFSYDIKTLSNRIVSRNYTSNINEIRSTVIQNLFAFLLKQDKLDELEIVLKDNNINNIHLAFCFLGVTTGFSSMSRVVTQSLANNMKLLEEFDKQVNRIGVQIWKKNHYLNRKSSENSLYSSELIPDHIFIDNEKEIELLLIDRIQKIRESKILKKLISKKKILILSDVVALFEEIEGDVFIHFNKGSSNYLYILLRSKNNSIILEEQNNFRGNLSQLGFEKSNISRIAQGNFPLFFYFKVDGIHDKPLSLDDKKILLDYLDLLINK